MNSIILFMAVVLFILINQYFGWNAFPESDAELICDAIWFVLFALGFLNRDQ